MANNLALARSFYAWIAKLEMNESDSVRKILPKTYPTAPDALYEVTLCLCENLQGTKYYPRACYWHEIFESAYRMDEGIKRKAVDFMKKLFVPKKTIRKVPPKGFILRKLEAFLQRLRAAYEKIDRGRRGFPAYNYFRRRYTEQEKEAIARSLDWLNPEAVRGTPEEEQAYQIPASRRKISYIYACARVALGSALIDTVRGILTLGLGMEKAWSIIGGTAEVTTSAARSVLTRQLGALEATIAVILYLVTVAFGEQSARDIFPS